MSGEWSELSKEMKSVTKKKVSARNSTKKKELTSGFIIFNESKDEINI